MDVDLRAPLLTPPQQGKEKAWIVQGPSGSLLCKVIFLDGDRVVEPLHESDGTRRLQDLSGHAVRTVAKSLEADRQQPDEKSTPLQD